MASFQIENVSIWTNKCKGSARLHMKEESQPGEKGKYIFLTQNETCTIDSKITVALSGGFSEVTIRDGAFPLVLSVNGDEFCFILGGEKAGYKKPMAKITFTKDSVISLRENVPMLKKRLKTMDKMVEQDVKRLEKFKNKAEKMKNKR